VAAFICPMHAEVRQDGPGKCPKCGMALLPEGTKFAMLRHMVKSPMMLIIMALVLFALMAWAMKS
jgi:hypothetical protein